MAKEDSACLLEGQDASIRRRRLTWLGHVATCRMSDDRRAEQAINWVSGEEVTRKTNEELAGGDHP